MSEEAKIIALQYVVVELVNQVKRIGGPQAQHIYEAAITAVMVSEYIDDEELKYAVKGAIEDMSAVVR